MQRLSSRWSAVLLAGVFGFAGGLWIFFSDRLLLAGISDPARLTAFQTVKGWFFVALAMVLVYALIRLAQVQAEQHLQEVQRLHRVQTVLSNINQTIVRVRDVEALLQRACAIAVEDGGLRCAWIAWINGGQGGHPGVGAQGRLAAWAVAPEASEALRQEVAAGLVSGELLSGAQWSALQAGTPCYETDLHQADASPPLFRLALAGGCRALALIPIRPLDTTEAVMVFCSADPGAFDTGERNLLRELAMDIGFALDFSYRETARQAAVSAFQESETRWLFALEGAEQGVWDWELATGKVYFSPQWKRMLGYAENEIEHQLNAWSERVHPDDLARVEGEIQRHLDGETPLYRSRYRLRCKDGSYRWVLDLGKVMERDGAGKPRRMIGTHTDVTEQQLLEEALRKSEAWVRSILDSAPDAMLVVNDAGEIAHANGSCGEIFGHDPRSLVGQPVELLLPERLRARHQDLRRAFGEHPERRAMGKGRFLAALHADGHEFPVEMGLSPLAGEESYTVVTVLDISDRRQAEAALQDSQLALERAQAMAHLGSWSMDMESLCIHNSAESARMAGLPPGETSLEDFARLVVPGDQHKLESAREAARRGDPVDLEVRICPRDSGGPPGGQRWLHITADVVATQGDGRRQAVGMMQDVTEIREAQAAVEAHKSQLEELVLARTTELHQQTRYLRALIDNFPFMIWLKDPQSRFLAVNRATADACGMGVAELVGKTDQDCLPEALAKQYLAGDLEVMQKREKKVVEEPFERQGERVWIETYKAPVIDEDGTVLGTVGFSRDISIQKALESARESALSEARRLAQVRSEFLANMSHEIRTPLNAVLGLAQVGERENAGRRARDTFSRIVEAGQILLGIVNDILDFSKIEAGKLELEAMPVDLGKVIDRVVDLTAPRALARGLQFLVEEAADLPVSFEGDALRLSQVMVNLLSNAVKFTEKGRVSLRLSRQEDELLIQVADTGVGMAASQVERLFSPFEQADGTTTRRFGGTGLGLAITKRLVDLMGGRIQVFSQPGSGSLFELLLPLRHGRWLPMEPCEVTVLLAGFDPEEALPVVRDMDARGIANRLVGTDDLALITPSPGEVMVLNCEPGHEGREMRFIERWQGQGGRLLVMTQGGAGHPGISLPGVLAVERPFRLRHLLRALRQEGESPRGRLSDGGRRLAGYRLLAAEDNEVNRLVLDQMLTLEGASLRCAENGNEALNLLESLGPERFDLVLTDIQMPGMDGYETAQHICKRYPGLPVVGLTAHAMAGERERCLAAGMKEHVAKPVDLDRLVTVIQTFGRRPPAPDPVSSGQDGPDGLATPPDSAMAGGPQGGHNIPMGNEFTKDSVVNPPGGPAGEGVEAVDWSALSQRYKGRQEFINRLVGVALDSQQDTAGKLRAGAAAGQWKDVRFLAHSLKGMCGNLLVVGLGETAATVERMAQQLATEPGTVEAEEACRSAAEDLAKGLDDLLVAFAQRLGR